jgi:hypothetical protein
MPSSASLSMTPAMSRMAHGTSPTTRAERAAVIAGVGPPTF